MLKFTNFFKQSPQNKLSLTNNTQLAYKGSWIQIYPDTEIDRWYVGDYSSANYTITVEFSSNKKEVLQVLIVARPDQASVTIFGRTSIDDSLVNITATVNDSYVSVIANATDTSFIGAKLIFYAMYAETITPLSVSEAVSYVDSSGSGGGYDGGGGSGGSGATAFTGLTDRSDLTVDQFYLPAITRLVVTANGSSAYRFDQYGTADDPTIYAISGTTIAFDLNNGLSSHPFLIRFSGANYDTGLVHVTAGGVVTTGSSAQGKTSGTLYWKVPAGISGTYGYLCQSHGTMAGSIEVKDISAI